MTPVLEAQERLTEKVRFVCENGCVHATVYGILSSQADIDELARAASLIVAQNPRRVIIDFARCDIVDTRSIAPLLRLRRELLASSASLQLINVHCTALELFKLIGLDQIIDIAGR